MNTLNPVDHIAAYFKQGYKTTEFWVALVVGLLQALVAAYDPGHDVRDQLSNLTWIAITYIASRPILKVGRLWAIGRAAAASGPSILAGGYDGPEEAPIEPTDTNVIPPVEPAARRA